MKLMKIKLNFNIFTQEKKSTEMSKHSLEMNLLIYKEN